MGLEIDLVKFKKSYFDSKKNKEGILDFHEARKDTDKVRYIHLAYWRKHHDILTVLVKYCGYEQCDYAELKRIHLKKALRIAVHGCPDGKYLKDEMKSFVKELRKILHQTNFKEETVALTWVS